MSEIILHEYELSPFSEKIRRILAYKNVPYSAVDQPVMAPKPDLTPLTGGYRRIPVMQIGADIYCDTALIARKIEALHPQPSIMPKGFRGIIGLIEDWADHRLFMHAVPPTLVGLMEALPPGFLDDRAAMTPAFAESAVVDAAAHGLAQTQHALNDINERLAEGRFMCCDEFTLADAACFHVVRFLRNNPVLEVEITSRPALAQWLKRIEDFGPGTITRLSAAQALEIARDAEPADVGGESVGKADFAPGDSVTIVADDYGKETTFGTVVRVLKNQVSVSREDAAVGRVVVHYPRAGYRIEKTA